MTAFAQNLKALRKAKKVIQQGLSEVLGDGYTAIANYESGRKELSLQDLIQIGDFFDVSIDELLGRVYPSKEKTEIYAYFNRLEETKQNAVLQIIKLMQ